MLKMTAFSALLTIVLLTGAAGAQGVNCGPAPCPPINPICDAPIVPLSPCCEPSYLFPPAPPIVAPVIVPPMMPGCYAVPTRQIQKVREN